MKNETFATTQQIKGALEKMAGSKFPVKITVSNGDPTVRYVRGFADAQANIVLLSETSYSLAMTILEIKEISVLEFAGQSPDREWIRMTARKVKKERT